MNDKYILDNKGRPVKEPDLMKWGRWFEASRSERIVKQEMIGKSKISTVFLGLDHRWLNKGSPLLWETMVFGGDMDQAQDRCPGTRKDAVAMHRRMVKRVLTGQ